MRPSSAATKCAIELLVSIVWAATVLTVASTFLTRWSSSATSARWCSSAHLRSGDVDVDAHHPLRTAVGVVGDEYARIDPPDIAAWQDDAIVQAVLARTLPEGAPAQLVQPRPVLGVHAGLPWLRGISVVPSGKPWRAT